MVRFQKIGFLLKAPFGGSCREATEGEREKIIFDQIRYARRLLPPLSWSPFLSEEGKRFCSFPRGRPYDKDGANEIANGITDSDKLFRRAPFSYGGLF